MLRIFAPLYDGIILAFFELTQTRETSLADITRVLRRLAPYHSARKNVFRLLFLLIVNFVA